MSVKRLTSKGCWKSRTGCNTVGRWMSAESAYYRSMIRDTIILYQEILRQADIRFNEGTIFADYFVVYVLMIVLEWSRGLKRIKRAISLALDIAAERLNEISLEDIEIERDSQDEIYQALIGMTLDENLGRIRPDFKEASRGVPCTGFWVEGTQELVLFAWSRERTKTIVIPHEDWFLRDDITLH